MNLNEQLQELYIQALHNNAEMLDAVELYNKNLDNESYATACPLLLSVNDYHSKWPKELTSKNYQSADVKVMIFGQETMGWWGCYGRSHAPKEIMDKYDWFTSGYCFDRGGSFWHSVRRIMELLQDKNKDKKIGFLWNNVVKMGYQIEGFPDKFYRSIVQPYFNHIVAKELEILKPDFIIFFTGPDYDHVINNIFGQLQTNKLDGFAEREFCEVKIPGVKKSLRTYHPSYLSRKGVEFRDKVLDKITTTIVAI